MLKTYIALKACFFATDILLEGEFIARIAFDGGIRYPHPVNGIFVTADPILQEAIEADKSFDTEFKLLRSEGTADDVKPLEVKIFNTNKEAKDWLNESHNVPYNKITNKEELVVEYKALGYELQFEK